VVDVAYCTREEIKTRLDFAEVALINSRVDAATLSGSRDVDQLIHWPDGGLAPFTGSFDFDWPDTMYPTPWRLWLDDRTLISLTSLVSGGISVPVGNVLLEPQRYGPPFDRLEIDISTNSAFNYATTWQRSIVVTGLWGYTNTEDPAGALAADVTTTSATTIDVSNSAIIGVGQVIRLGSERLTVSGKTMITTGQSLLTPVGATMAEQTLAVTTGSAYAVGETLLLDAERMLITDIASNNLIVKRAYDGTTLAAHSAPVIFAGRRLTVARGQLGTSAATYTNGAAIVKWRVPSKANELAIAEGIDRLLQETSGYSRTVGAADALRAANGAGLTDARCQAMQALGRQGRFRTV